MSLSYNHTAKEYGGNILMTYEPARWRLLHTAPAAGAWNMAVDEAVLESVASGDSLPTLRLYSWEPPCLSLGYAQSASEVDLTLLNRSGWHLVRRPTGGRAILHADELTYSVIAPIKEPRVAGSILESYSRLALALLSALEILSLPAHAQVNPDKTNSTHNTNPVCFEVPSNYEILINGRKIIGSAQARRKAGVLQHGSLPLYGDLTRITQVLHFENEESREEAASRLLEHATTVELVTGIKVLWDQAASALSSAFSNCLNIIFEIQPLTLEERKRALRLVDEKYNHPGWTRRI
jgi:lipoyl(octanoyl) transferase